MDSTRANHRGQYQNARQGVMNSLQGTIPEPLSPDTRTLEASFDHFIIRVLIRNQSLFTTCHFLEIRGWISGASFDHF